MPKVSQLTSNYVSSGQQRYLRACMVCSIVMTYSVRREPALLPIADN